MGKPFVLLLFLVIACTNFDLANAGVRSRRQAQETQGVSSELLLIPVRVVEELGKGVPGIFFGRPQPQYLLLSFIPFQPYEPQPGDVPQLAYPQGYLPLEGYQTQPEDVPQVANQPPQGYPAPAPAPSAEAPSPQAPAELAT